MAFAAALWLGVAVATAGESGIRMELALGGARSLASTLRLEQGGTFIHREAEWSTRSFEAPLYYALRLARMDDSGGWALRFVHHKVHLESPPPEIERFSVSHGYNLLTLERAFPLSGFEVWAGAGFVIAHPETSVRGGTQSQAGGAFSGGYQLTGPTGAIGVARRLELGRRLALVPELRFTLSRAHVSIAGGQASVPNAAFHLTLGLEARF